MNCLKYNEPVIYILLDENVADCFLSQKGFDELPAEQQNSNLCKKIDEVFPDEMERKNFFQEYSEQLENARKEITNQKETVKDCFENFIDEVKSKVHKNITDNNMPNIMDYYNDHFSESRNTWQEENSLKNLRRLAENYAMLLKIKDYKEKANVSKESEQSIHECIKKELDRLYIECYKVFEEMHKEHHEGVTEFITNSFAEDFGNK